MTIGRWIGRVVRLRRVSAQVAMAAGAVALSLAATHVDAQPEAPANGPRWTNPGWHALTHATLIPEPGRIVDDATVVIRDGRIVSVETGGEVPAGAREWDCSGLHVYAGLVEPFWPVAAPKPDRSKPGAHWNPLVTPERSALHGDGIPEKERKALRALGYAVAAIAPTGGAFQGSSAVVSLSERLRDGDRPAKVLSALGFQVVSFATAGRGTGDYPNSKMGSIALIRQTLADASWYVQAAGAYRAAPDKHERPAPSDASEALLTPVPLAFDVSDELDALRAAKIAAEFGRPSLIVGSGTEFRRLDAIADTKMPFIVPLAFPETPKVASPGERESVGLRELMLWEAAPTNAARLDKAGVKFALTSSKLPKDQKFFDNLRLAIAAGLPENRALAMLTTEPAQLLGVGNRVGRVEPGMDANLVVVKGTLFDKDRVIRDVWIDGDRYEVTSAPVVDLEGRWEASFSVAGQTHTGTLTIDRKNAITFERAASGEQARDKDKEKKESFKARSVSVSDNRLSFALDGEALGLDGVLALSAVAEDRIYGSGRLPDGAAFTWSATRAAADPEAQDKVKDAPKEKDEFAKRLANVLESFGYPFGPFAYSELPPQEDELLITNARIWTSSRAGIIEKGEMLIRKGKIVHVGESRGARAPRGARVLDLGGKNVTPGLIDCHSHTGISGGVNESRQAVTAEVRIGDVINPDAINWYRELAGGLTVVNQLHGSANPIGGQNSVVKIRWGARHPQDMKLEGAVPGIKFALGENVKQSNWESDRSRYPQTRMGVETLIVDRFTAAREYAERWKAWRKLDALARGKAVQPRRDLELEALAEILDGERLIHCHSYRQDEILMLCRVAKQFGFQIGTFQHVLEGYKVAEAIRDSAIGGSTFTDWWAYKFEVIDAIPGNGALMHQVGVSMSFNSDSDELARRLNVEAAKAVRYGGLSPEEALAFVTINPAEQLRIDEHVGSLEVGKDADFVIWSADPLSVYARSEATYIDGREYFSLERDAELRRIAASERDRIIQKILSLSKKDKDRKGGEGGAMAAHDAPPETLPQEVLAALATPGRGRGLAPVGAEAIEKAREHAFRLMLERRFEWLTLNGIDVSSMRCGDCGASLDAHLLMRD